jgi:hypothetical protein
VGKRIWHASLLLALLAVAASFGHQHSRLTAAAAYDGQAVNAGASDLLSAANIGVAKTAITRIPSRSKTSGDRITGAKGPLLPPLAWRYAVECATTVRHLDQGRSRHSGRAPPVR